MTKNRLEAFSDGVFAIAITLLVIEIRPPELHEGDRLAQALWAQWPSYVAYLVSFLTIGVIWLNHHRIFDQVARVDGPLLLLNLNLLLWTALIPFPTAVVAEHLGGAGEAARTAAALYSGVLLLMGLAFGALFAWVTHTDRLLRRLPPPGEVRTARLRFMLGLAVYAAAFLLSWVSAPLSLLLCGLMALYYAFDQASAPAEPEPG
ncbi:MAG TPA: TMEM175 family protein [Actinomycetes bacterium]|nr:TMEM175 family protein [Actinomycetes bacterium]